MQSPVPSNYERWIWIELIGFDNTRPGVGVKDYLDTFEFTPHAISLLLTSPDMIHQHTPLETKVDLPPDICSYFGHPQNPDRRIQVWTNHQLRELVDEFHKYGVKVFFATFTSFLDNSLHQEWVSDHRELFEKRRNGEANQVIFPIKRFKDGTYYEDFMIPKLGEVLTDYNFDGWHAADGWGPARLPLSESDYSDDMFEQFVNAQGITVPDNIALICDDCNEKLGERAAWIWSNLRRPWIDFYTDRWAAFYNKKVAALHALGKEVVINSAWTRDPFEAIYRFGIDYRKIIASGIDGIVTESAAGASDMEAEEGSRVYLYNYVATLMMIRAYNPAAKLIFLHGINDFTEQWDLIHHAPTVLESEIFSLTGVYRRTGEGTLQRCADGFMVCLGDAIKAEEWQWLERRWKLGFTDVPQRVIGATLLWSNEALSNELNDFIANREIITHRLLTYLTEQNAPVQSAIRIEDIAQAQGCLLVLNAHNFPDEQLQQALAYKGGPVVFIGRDIAGLPKPDFEIAAPVKGLELFCRVWNADAALSSQLGAIEVLKGEPEALDIPNLVEPLSFIQYLPMQEPHLDFINGCAQVIAASSGPIRVASGQDFINTMVTETAPNKLRVVVRNRRLAYCTPTIDVGASIKSLDILTEFPSTDLVPSGSKFSVKVPGRGATVVEVELEG